LCASKKRRRGCSSSPKRIKIGKIGVIQIKLEVEDGVVIFVGTGACYLISYFGNVIPITHCTPIEVLYHMNGFILRTLILKRRLV